jgi:hypothetical protein
MSKKFEANQVDSLRINLLIDGEEYLTGGPPNFWRVTTEGGLILCMKCNNWVDPRLKDLVLWCSCAECGTHNIEDILDDLDDPPP